MGISIAVSESLPDSKLLKAKVANKGKQIREKEAAIAKGEENISQSGIA